MGNVVSDPWVARFRYPNVGTLLWECVSSIFSSADDMAGRLSGASDCFRWGIVWNLWDIHQMVDFV
jgi:hypothetical protein